MMLIFCQAAIAQNKSPEKIAEKRVANLENKIQLDANQKVQITDIITESSEKIIALKQDGVIDADKRKVIKTEERAAIAAILSAEQKEKLKDANKIQRAEKKVVRKEMHQMRKEFKSSLDQKRDAFNAELSADETAIIDKAKAMVPAKLSKTEKASITSEQKTERKKAMKNVRKMLNPVVENHKSQLDIIKGELGEMPKGKKPKQARKKSKKGFYYTFLLS